MPPITISAASVSQRFVLAYYHLAASGAASTKADFSRTINLRPQNFRNIEAGNCKPTIQNICDLISHYSVSPTWLFTGKGAILG